MQTRPATIYALATPPGKGGVAIIRISGPNATAALAALSVATPAPRLATLARLCHGEQVLDEALALYFAGPNSFTGEDVVELHTHGGRAVVQAVLAALADIDELRLADPGEFTRRAFLNGKIDLAQAEGLADLIDAETTAQHRQALRQFGGEASRRIADLRERVLNPLALLEAYIDFPDEEIPEGVLTETAANVQELEREIGALLDDGGIGEKIRGGMEIVILGPPNAGKSSLLNALSRRDAAIVAAEAGTTRDLIEVHLDLGGYEVTLVDTAGLRETEAAIEAEGIRRARARAETADFRLILLDGETALDQLDSVSSLLSPESVLVVTKADLGAAPALPHPHLSISTRTGEGLEVLIAQLQQWIGERVAAAPSPLITRARHREALVEAQHALAGWGTTLPLELSCEQLRYCASALGKITGKIWVDDVLDLVFRRFCIGK